MVVPASQRSTQRNLPGEGLELGFGSFILKSPYLKILGLTKTQPFSLNSLPINHHHSSLSNPPLAAASSLLVSRLHSLP